MRTLNLNYLFKEFNELKLKNGPEELYYEGNINLLNQGRRVSVIGSRKVSELGKKRTELITKELVKHEIIVVSGLAEGVDTVAHHTAINSKGKTVTFLGTSFDKVYPKSNSGLLEAIKTNHLAVTQFTKGNLIQKGNFVRRNRLMALFSDATIIIEASENSGTRHQGWEALRLGRLVFLMENVANDKNMTWPAEMIKYGAQVLTRENLEDSLYEIPRFSERGEIVI